MPEPRPESAHEHRWSLVSTTEGDALARCRCGHERLLTGTTLRARSAADRRWITPKIWNTPRLRGSRN